MGFSCDKVIKEAKPSDKQKLELKLDGKQFLQALVKKILAKCSIIYSLVKYMACLDPNKMALQKDQCVSNFRKLLHILVNNEKVKEQDCDILIHQFTFFLDEIPKFGSERFRNFNKANDSVDQLLYECMSQDISKYNELLELVKLLLTLSHGQAAVERGFSVNKEVEKRESIIAQCMICEHVRSVKGIMNVDLSKELCMSVKGARQKYERFLEEERQQKKTANELAKRKHVLEEISELQKKKVKLEVDVSELTSASEKLCDKAETTGKLTFLTQANSLRRSAKEKQIEVQQIEEKLKQKTQ